MRTSTLFTVLAFVGLAVPATVQADAFKPSKNEQVKLGEDAAAQLRRKEKVLPSTDPRVRTVRRVANRLLSTIDDGDDPWRYSFDVIESKQVNAFALPGGPTFVYTGLLDKLKTEDELAGVLGHELTHVRREHWAYAYADSQKRQLGLSLLLGIVKANRVVGSAAGLTNALVFDLPFSRSHETQADEGGLTMMAKAGYNPQGMIDVFTMLSKEAQGGKPPEFLSDHPNDSRRIGHMKDEIAKMGGNYPASRPLRMTRDASDTTRDRYWDGYRGLS